MTKGVDADDVTPARFRDAMASGVPCSSDYAGWRGNDGASIRGEDEASRLVERAHSLHLRKLTLEVLPEEVRTVDLRTRAQDTMDLFS